MCWRSGIGSTVRGTSDVAMMRFPPQRGRFSPAAVSAGLSIKLLVVTQARPTRDAGTARPQPTYRVDSRGSAVTKAPNGDVKYQAMAFGPSQPLGAGVGHERS